jgi:hypothetical protein
MSGEDVKHKSKTVVETRQVNFPLIVPSGEGRMVNEKTTVTSITTLFEAALRTEGSVGIEVDPGFFTPNFYWWYYNIEDVFPNAEATSRIARSSTNTNIDTKVLNIPKQADGKEAEIVEYHSFNSDIAAVGFKGPGIAVSSTAKDSPPGPSPFLASMKIEVQFAEVKPEVPAENRQGDIEELKALILTKVHAIGNPSAISYAPNFASASFSISYNPQQITKAELGAAVINQAHGVQWRGQYAIYFS